MAADDSQGFGGDGDFCGQKVILWSLLESDSLLMLEDPELSLHTEIGSQLAALISRMQKNQRRQIFVSTHSDALLRDPGIDGREVLLLMPAKAGTEVKPASDLEHVRERLENGLTAGEAVPSTTRPKYAEQFSLLC